jgi:hypothetical protein
MWLLSNFQLDSSLDDSALTEQIAALEDQIHFYTLQLDQIRFASPAVQDMKAQVSTVIHTVSITAMKLMILASDIDSLDGDNSGASNA